MDLNVTSFDIREEYVLLSFVEPVDLIKEDDCRLVNFRRFFASSKASRS